MKVQNNPAQSTPPSNETGRNSTGPMATRTQKDQVSQINEMLEKIKQQVEAEKKKSPKLSISEITNKVMDRLKLVQEMYERNKEIMDQIANSHSSSKPTADKMGKDKLELDMDQMKQKPKQQGA